jgi:hypothetical protein
LCSAAYQRILNCGCSRCTGRPCSNHARMEREYEIAVQAGEEHPAELVEMWFAVILGHAVCVLRG